MRLKTLSKKNEQLKFDLLKKLTEQPQVPMQELMTMMDMTRSAVYYAVKHLIDDLEYFQIPVKITYQNKTYTTYFTKENMTALAVQSQLLDQYMQISPSFQLLTIFLKMREISLMDTANQLQLSMTHIYKIVRTASDFLDAFDLLLVIEHKRIHIIGPEHNLVAFRFFMQTFLSSDIHSFFDHQKNQFVGFPNNYELDRLSASNKQALFALLEVMENGNLNEQAITQQLQSSTALTLIQQLDGKKIPMGEAWKAFYIRIFFPQVISEKEMIACGKIIQNNPDLPSAQIAIDILDYIINAFERHDLPMDSANYYVFLYILTLHLLYIQFFGKDIKQIFYSQQLQESVPDYESDLYQSLEIYFDKFQSKTIAWPRKKECKQVILDTLYLLIRNPEKPQIAICLDFLGNIIAETAFKQKLNQLFCDSIFTYTNCEKNADVLITNHIARIESETLKIFHIQNLADQSAWERIYTELFQLAYQKSNHARSFQ